MDVGGGRSGGGHGDVAVMETGAAGGKEVADVGVEFSAAGGPYSGGAEVFDADFGVGEFEVADAEFLEFFEAGAEEVEEGEFDTVCFDGEGAEGEGDWGRGEGEVVADIAEADGFEGMADAVAEFCEGDGGALVAILEVDEETACDVSCEPPTGFMASGLGGGLDGFDDPLFFVVGGFAWADEEEWEARGESDHGGRREVAESVEEFGLAFAAWVELFHGVDGFDEFADVLELAVDAGVADVGDRVYGVEFFHDADADGAGIEFAFGVGFEFGDDVVGGLFEGGERDGAFFAGFDEAFEEFFAAEGFAGTVSFYDDHIHLFDFLVGGESEGAGEAFSASADGCAFTGGP